MNRFWRQMRTAAVMVAGRIRHQPSPQRPAKESSSDPRALPRRSSARRGNSLLSQPRRVPPREPVESSRCSASSVTLVEALDVALCFGWIDSQRKGGNEHDYLQRYSPRWSQVNVAKVEALVAAGRMRAPGLAAVRATQADGAGGRPPTSRSGAAAVPPDLAAGLEHDAAGQAAFDALDKTARYAPLLRLMKAPTPARRAVELEHILIALAPPIEGGPGPTRTRSAGPPVSAAGRGPRTTPACRRER